MSGLSNARELPTLLGEVRFDLVSGYTRAVAHMHG